MSEFMAGAGSAAIQFQKELFPLEGFYDVHDEPHARVLIMEEKCVLLVLELVMLFDDSIEELKKIIADSVKVKKENIWIHLTHAITPPHAPGGPLLGSGGQIVHRFPGMEEPAEDIIRKRLMYDDAVQNAVRQAVYDAEKSMRKAKTGVGSGACDVNGNRDMATSTGWWIGEASAGLSNKTMTILRIDDEEGNLLAILISYGIKPCAIDNSQMKEGKRLVSSDIPGKACSLMEEKYGIPVLFCMSAAGDQVPKQQAWYDVVHEDGTIEICDKGVEYGLNLVDKYGKIMADAAIEIVDGIQTLQKECLISVAHDSFTWNTKGRIDIKPRMQYTYESDGKTIEVPVDVMKIGKLVLIGMKPEINYVTELERQKASPVENTLVVSMLNGGMKYMPDKKSYENITWESMNSMLMPGAAETFVEKAVQMLRQ